jgi:hypothetical protein
MEPELALENEALVNLAPEKLELPKLYLARFVLLLELIAAGPVPRAGARLVLVRA